MFTHEQNDLLTRVEAGSAMGDLFRSYWLPFLMDSELEIDGPPKRVRLYGEDLVAFRDSKGRVGLVSRYCAHRRADLFFGRNEECGLRCTYHGWKYDVTGHALELPAEPDDTPLKKEVKIKSYPTREAGGVIWTYMGPPDRTPRELPQLEWVGVPASHRCVTKRLQQSNFAQAVEGGLDSSHVSFLHRTFTAVQHATTNKEGHLVQRPIYMVKDTKPRFFIHETDYGFMIGARRNASETEYYWRLSQFLMPSYTIVPSSEGRPLTGHVWVPIDDENCWAYTISWHPDRPLTEEEFAEYGGGEQIHAAVDENYRPLANKDNNYKIDREMQRKENFTGIVGVGIQDMSVQEGMGQIVDRTQEVLGASDTAIVFWRRLMIAQATSLRGGSETPLGLSAPHSYRVRSGAILLEKERDVFKIMAERLAPATA
jgi:phenylpropionate dioxygenase-like ring-hydroxylating dioxygenase large terminal subunit